MTIKECIHVSAYLFNLRTMHQEMADKYLQRFNDCADPVEKKFFQDMVEYCSAYVSKIDKLTAGIDENFDAEVWHDLPPVSLLNYFFLRNEHI